MIESSEYLSLVFVVVVALVCFHSRLYLHFQIQCSSNYEQRIHHLRVTKFDAHYAINFY